MQQGFNRVVSTCNNDFYIIIQAWSCHSFNYLVMLNQGSHIILEIKSFTSAMICDRIFVLMIGEIMIGLLIHLVDDHFVVSDNEC